jgi:topoisomerase IV subunit A
MAKKPQKKIPEQIVGTSFTQQLSERYFAYALSTITSRSLPDVRDGLKPVHRRLLWAMLQLHLDPASGYKKCARVVGDVIGKYHPHGDVAVYETMVRLAQEFSVRYPLVEGQGNFGSIDGDNAAAMRYTEARLTEVAMAIVQDINDDTVDFRPTYDNTDEEPVVMPSAFPNLLANGSEGIAVGMATSIPPHNAGEVCDGLLAMIKTPDIKIEKLMNYISGPDFPTGGVIIENRETITEAYRTGRGSFRVRASYEVEDLGGGQWQIIVTEVPYQVNKSKLIEKIADLFKEKKLPLLGHIQDESAESMRIVLEPKSKNVDPEVLMESLFRTTDLENRFSLNMNVLDANMAPRVMGLPEVLRAFLDHRHEVLVRKSKNRLKDIDHRLEILGGLLIAYLNIDEIIKIIREEDEPKKVMIKRFNLTDIQAEAILNMKLRNLRKLEEFEIRKEHDALSKEKKALEKLLKNEDLRWEAIAEQITEIKNRFGQKTKLGRRRTVFALEEPAKIVDISAFVEKEPVTVLCSKLGWIRAMKGHAVDLTTVKYKEGDEEGIVLKCQTTDKLLMFATDGKAFTLACDKLPSGKGQGEAIRMLAELGQDQDIVSLNIYDSTQKFLLVSNVGKGFVVPAEELMASKKGGKLVLGLPDGAKAVFCEPINGDHVALVSNGRKMLILPIADIPEMRKGQGVVLQKLHGSEITGVAIFKKNEGITWHTRGKVYSESNIREWLGKRGHTGRQPPRGFPQSNRFDG